MEPKSNKVIRNIVLSNKMRLRRITRLLNQHRLFLRISNYWFINQNIHELSRFALLVLHEQVRKNCYDRSNYKYIRILKYSGSEEWQFGYIILIKFPSHTYSIPLYKIGNF
jgi:hypothetical protein